MLHLIAKFLILLHGMQVLPGVFRRLLLVAVVDLLVRIKSEEAQAFSPSVKEAPSRRHRVVVVVRRRPIS